MSRHAMFCIQYRSLRLPAGAISLVKQRMDVADGEQYISSCEYAQAGNHILLPIEHERLQRVLQQPDTFPQRWQQK